MEERCLVEDEQKDAKFCQHKQFSVFS